MTDEVKTAANYIDPLKSSNNISAVSNITIGWKENDSKDKKLERIITQKWIATFPNGQEAWTEFRRTGYPKLFPVAVIIAVEQLIRIFKYADCHLPNQNTL